MFVSGSTGLINFAFFISDIETFLSKTSLTQNKAISIWTIPGKSGAPGKCPSKAGKFFSIKKENILFSFFIKDDFIA